MDVKDKVVFDPGYAKHLTMFSQSVEYLYSSLNRFKNLNQKKFQFKMIYPQISKMIEQNIAFYMGCMLWASYIKYLGDYEILEHPCLGEEYNEEFVLNQITYLQEFIQKFDKDCKYYLASEYKIDEKKEKILKLYRKFIVENKGFVETKTSGQVVIPKVFEKLSKKKLEEIGKKIEEVTETGNLEELFIFCDRI